jgi:late competence protein required for DNA uptake (superfamily II DNA/RNA helicase)
MHSRFSLIIGRSASNQSLFALAVDTEPHQPMLTLKGHLGPRQKPCAKGQYG